MIIDVYVSSRGINFIDIKIIADSADPVQLDINESTEILKTPAISNSEKHFFSFKKDQLLPGKDINIIASQDTKEQIKFTSSTLEKPEGKHLFRFGILPDIHLDSHYINTSKNILNPQKRLYEKSLELAKKYIQKIKNMNAEFIIFPGDILHRGSTENLNLAVKLLSKSPIKCYAMIGNHETDHLSIKEFYKAFNLPETGYYAFSINNFRFLLLCTPNQESLNVDTNQFKWLQNELNTYSKTHNILIFSHFSIILHNCVQKEKNDGMQQFYNFKDILDLLNEHPGVKAFFAGHKNIPSFKLVNNISHFLCPQIIQAPCCFDIIDIYENGMTRTIHEIDEQDYVMISRKAHGQINWMQRSGSKTERNVSCKF